MKKIVKLFIMLLVAFCWYSCSDGGEDLIPEKPKEEIEGPKEEPKEEPEKKNNSGIIIVILILAVGGGAAAFLRYRRERASARGGFRACRGMVSRGGAHC